RFGRPDQQVMHEHCMIRSCANDSDFESMMGIPSSKSIKTIQLLPRVQIINRPFPVDLETVFGKWKIDGAPPNVLLRLWMLHNPLVFGRSTGLGTGVSHERS